MCGIVALVDTRDPPAPRVVAAMRDQLSHRGPDDVGLYVHGQVGLGHRRLSILDLSPAGRQPMPNEDESLWLVFNGEIYNYLELRAKLIAQGHRFRSETDSEVILHLYEAHGEDCLHHLRGMYAFVLWDTTRKTLFAARDRLGKKPLYFSQTPTGLAIASEIKALLARPGQPRRPRPQAIHEFLVLQYIPSPGTAFSGISRLPPGHSLTWQDGELRTARYWRPVFTPKHQFDEEEAAEALLDVLQQAVRLRLRADVPWGVQLSGGLDSSLISALAVECGGEVRTFTAGFEEAAFDERTHARRVARYLGTTHEEVQVRKEALEQIPRLALHFDQPFGDPAAVPTYLVSELTRRSVTVALNGDGGDEIFGGYGRYGGALHWRLFNLLPRVLRADPLWELVGRGLGRMGLPGSASLAKFHRYGRESLPSHYARLMSRLTPEHLAGMYSEQMQKEAAGWDPTWAIRQAFEMAHEDGLGPLDTLLAVDTGTYLPDCLLVKVDVASMACGLEVRSPLLDQEVVEFVGRLPEPLKAGGAIKKRVLRRVARRFLPPQIVDRPKAGFGVPLASWFRADGYRFLRRMLSREGLSKRGYFQPEALSRLVSAQEHGDADRATFLWSLLLLEVWHRVVIEGEPLDSIYEQR